MFVIGLSNLRQNVLIGQSQRLNFSIQSVPNRLSVSFSTYAKSFFVIPFTVTVRTISPKSLYYHLIQNVLSFSFSVKLVGLDLATDADLLLKGRNPSQAGILRSC